MSIRLWFCKFLHGEIEKTEKHIKKQEKYVNTLSERLSQSLTLLDELEFTQFCIDTGYKDKGGDKDE